MGFVRVLWVCGPSGVGKSTVAWQVFQRIGWPRLAYVDIDQLGLRYPSPADDPSNGEIKVANLARVIRVHADSGARHVIVSGIGTGDHLERLRRLMPGIDLFVCRLRADSAVLTDRFIGRGGVAAPLDEVLDDARRLDASDFADLVLDTTSMSPESAANRIMDRVAATIGDLPDSTPRPPLPVIADGVLPPILWLHGARAVGSSTVGFALFQQLIVEGQTVAYIDLAQVGFQRPALDETAAGDLSVAAVRALGSVYRTHGARFLILVGQAHPATVTAMRSSAGGTELTVCRLTAGADVIAERVAARARGGPVHLAGDDLRGASPAVIDRITTAAQAQAVMLERMTTDDSVLDTSVITVDESVAAVREAAALTAGGRRA